MSDAALIEQLKQKLATSEHRLQSADLKMQLLEEHLRPMSWVEGVLFTSRYDVPVGLVWPV